MIETLLFFLFMLLPCCIMLIAISYLILYCFPVKKSPPTCVVGTLKYPHTISYLNNQKKRDEMNELIECRKLRKSYETPHIEKIQIMHRLSYLRNKILPRLLEIEPTDNSVMAHLNGEIDQTRKMIDRLLTQLND